MKYARLLSTLLLILLSLLSLTAPAAAHEGREVGEYVIVFGWRVEPALAGQLNGPELYITHHDSDEPVEGAEATLQLEVSMGDQSMIVPLRAAWQEPGHYIGDLIPTRPGDYSFRLTGTIGETSIDEVFTSADGEFSTVEPASDVMFPQISSETSLSDLKAQIAELQTQLAALQAKIEELQAQ